MIIPADLDNHRTHDQCRRPEIYTAGFMRGPSRSRLIESPVIDGDQVPVPGTARIRRALLGAVLITLLAFSAVSCGGKQTNGPPAGTPTPSPTVAQLPITRSSPVASAPVASDEPSSDSAMSDEDADGPDGESPAPSETQAEPTPTPTPAPSTNPSPSIPAPAPPSSVQFGLVKGAPPGQTANVMIQTTPNTACALKFKGPDNGESTADGLGLKTTDAQGRAYWEWKIDPQSPAGTGTATATCNGDSVSVPVRVGGVG